MLPSARTSSTEASPVNSFSSQPVGVPLAGKLAGSRSDTGTRTRPAASAVGRLTPAAITPVARAGGTGGRPAGVGAGAGAGEADGEFASEGGDGTVSRGGRAPEPALAATWPK